MATKLKKDGNKTQKRRQIKPKKTPNKIKKDGNKNDRRS
jgi:hypothetical protein